MESEYVLNANLLSFSKIGQRKTINEFNRIKINKKAMMPFLPY